MRTRLNGVMALVVMAVIAYLSLKPGSYAPGTGSGPSYISLVYHSVAYFGLAAALMLYFHDTELGHLEAVITASVFGLGMEILQAFIPLRFFAFKDIAVNVLGASIVLLDHRSVLVTRAIRLEDWFLEKAIEKSPFNIPV